MIRAINQLSDRFLSMVLPSTSADATSCWVIDHNTFWTQCEYECYSEGYLWTYWDYC